MKVTIEEIYVGSDSTNSSEEVIILDGTEVTTIDETETPLAGDSKEALKNKLSSSLKTIEDPETPEAGPSGTNNYLLVGFCFIIFASAILITRKIGRFSNS